MTNNSLERVSLTYDQIPFYRKRWFVVLSLIFFAPSTILIVLTGDIYAQKKDGVYQYTKMKKNLVLLIALAFSVQGLARLYRLSK